MPVGSAEGSGVDTGREAAAGLLDRADRPTAILALYDEIALGVLDAARSRGIAVPHQLSVAGFDDVPAAATADPPLTTVRQPHELKGSEAVRLLLEAEGPASVQLPTELVVRASTGPSPGRSTP